MASGLLFIVVLCMTTGLWIGANAECIPTVRAVTCEGSVATLKCAVGQVIAVHSADYGRHDQTTCASGRPVSQIQNVRCSRLTTKVAERCNGRSICAISASNSEFGDPCFGTYKYLEVIYTCQFRAVTCEGSVATLKCAVGQVIAVLSADYGRHDQTTCASGRPVSQIQNVRCSRLTTKVAERCNGRSICAISASNSEFGDPCFGTYKYLEVIYTCQCTPAWILFGGRLYQFHNSEKDWADAESFCTSLGGNLASLRSIEIYNFVREIIFKATNSHKTTWVGGYDAVKEGVWLWSDGSYFAFNRWGKGEPNNLGNEDCIEINFAGQDYVNDAQCELKRPFVCARSP